MIRWNKSDYVRLGKAVADYNRIISHSTSTSKNAYLPKKINYKELKADIQTRQGLNAYLQQLKRASLPGAMEIEQLEGGVAITRYQRRELQRSLAVVIPKLEADIQKLQEKTLISYNKGVNEKLDDVFKSDPQKKLEARLSDYQNLFTLSGSKFRYRAEQLLVNQTEKKYRQAYLFRQRYMKEMREKYRNYRDYWIFIKYYADKHKDPVSFYNDLPDDDTYFPNDLYRQSDETFTDEEFTGFVEDILGMSVDEIYEKEGKKQGKTGEDLKIEKQQESTKKKELAETRASNKINNLLF